jgi:TRAP-type C4-dicarboxylate transport system substrate-binding protein
MKLTRRQFGSAAVAAAIVSQVGLSRPAHAKVSLKCGSAANDQYVGVKFTRAWLEELKKRTNGEVEGTVFAGTLGGEQAMLEGMAVGTLDLYQGAYTGTREYDIFYTANFFRNYEHAIKVVNNPTIRPRLEKVLADKYQGQLIGVGRAGAFGLYMRTKIDSWADLRNKKIRAGAIEGVLEGLKAFGANPTPIPFNEVYSALQQGVVEGQVTLSSLVIVQKYYEVCKYAVANEFGLGLDKFVIAQRVWRQISPAHQKIMIDTFNEMEPAGYDKPVREEREDNFKKWEGFNGAGSVLKLDDAEGQRLTSPVAERLANGVLGAGSWKAIQDTV